MKRDAQLIDLFLVGFAKLTGRQWRLKERPDERERTKPAIDAIAADEAGKTLALEHTLIQPFEGQKSDDQPFNAVFEALSKDDSCLIEGRLVQLWSPAFAIPKGMDWQEVREKVLDWYRKTAPTFPEDGEATYDVPGLAFELRIHVQVMPIPGTPGLVMPGRVMPKEKGLPEIVRKALGEKLPKLAKAEVDERILLLEGDSMAFGLTQVARELDAHQKSFEEFKKIRAVWIAVTASWEKGRQIWFFHVWPTGVRERFLINVDSKEVQISNRK